MTISPCYPYKSEAARERCFDYFDSLAAKVWPAGWEERTVPTSFGGTFVRIGGPSDAPPLVLLHGAGATSLMWSPNVRELSKERCVIAVDQMGEFGKSSCVKPPRSVGDLVAWLDELFDGLGLKTLAVAGLSYGGALTAQYALRHPERIERIVLIAPGSTALRTSIEFWARLIYAGIARRHGGVQSFMRWIFPDMQRKDPGWVAGVAEELALNIETNVLKPRIFPPVLTDDEWRSFQFPTLFLVGEHERIYSPEKAVGRLKRVAPGISTDMIPGAGHDLTFAQPELVNRMMVEFLKRAPMAAAASFRT